MLIRIQEIHQGCSFENLVRIMQQENIDIRNLLEFAISKFCGFGAGKYAM